MSWQRRPGWDSYLGGRQHPLGGGTVLETPGQDEMIFRWEDVQAARGNPVLQSN